MVIYLRTYRAKTNVQEVNQCSATELALALCLRAKGLLMTKRRKLKTRIAMGRGEQPADLVLRGGRVLDLIIGDFLEGDVAIAGDLIVGTGAS